MVHQLVDRRIDEAGELDLGDRAKALRGKADRHPGDGPFGERRVEDAVGSEALQEPVGGAEDAALGGDILAEDEDRGILLHGASERQIDGLDQGNLGHRGLTSPARRVPHGADRRDPGAKSRR